MNNISYPDQNVRTSSLLQGVMVTAVAAGMMVAVSPSLAANFRSTWYAVSSPLESKKHIPLYLSLSQYPQALGYSEKIGDTEFPSEGFNFDLARMDVRLNDEFVLIPETVKSFEDFDRWLDLQ